MGGSQGEVTLRLLASGGLEVSWVANQMGDLGLISGTATLVRKLDGKGRVAAFEVLVATPAVRNLIRENKTYQIASLIQTGAVWNYLAGPTGAPPTWASLGFNDAGWSNGAAELGNGDTVDGRPETTLINIGPANARYPAVYFRRAFTIADPASVTNLSVALLWCSPMISLKSKNQSSTMYTLR